MAEEVQAVGVALVVGPAPRARQLSEVHDWLQLPMKRCDGMEAEERTCWLSLLLPAPSPHRCSATVTPATAGASPPTAGPSVAPQWRIRCHDAQVGLCGCCGALQAARLHLAPHMAHRQPRE